MSHEKDRLELNPEQEKQLQRSLTQLEAAEKINEREREVREAREYLQSLRRSPITHSEFGNGLDFSNRIFEDLIEDPDLQIVVDITEKPGQGKTHTRKALVTDIGSRIEKQNHYISIAVLEFDTDAEDVVGQMIANEITRRDRMGRHYEYSDEYNELLEAMVDLEPKITISTPDLREILKKQFDISNTIHLPERYRNSATHNNMGKHADYTPDANAFLRAARSYLAIKIARELQAGTRVVVVEHSSGLKVRLPESTATLTYKKPVMIGKTIEVELRSYPHDLMFHLKSGRGPFNNEASKYARIAYCSVVGGLVTVEIMDKVRAALQKAQDLDEASAISKAFTNEGITSIDALIEKTKGGSLDVIVLTALQEKQIIDEYGIAMGLHSDHPQLFEMATVEHTDDSKFALQQMEEYAQSQITEQKTNEEAGDFRLVLDIVNQSKSLLKFLGEEESTDLLVYYASLQARKILASKIHQTFIQDLEADYELHAINEASLPNEKATVMQILIIKAILTYINDYRLKLNQPDS